MEMAGIKVLDLGCGAALPGLYCFSKGAEGAEILSLITFVNN